jgi:hypothetical protein
LSGFVADRSFAVPAGAIVRTGYVAVDKVRLKCRARMAIGDVEAAHRRLLQLGSACSFPPPNGRWDGETFEIADGRHEYVAALMLGRSHILVAWMEERR